MCVTPVKQTQSTLTCDEHRSCCVQEIPTTPCLFLKIPKGSIQTLSCAWCSYSFEISTPRPLISSQIRVLIGMQIRLASPALDCPLRLLFLHFVVH